jgi:hypothetical protein
MEMCCTKSQFCGAHFHGHDEGDEGNEMRTSKWKRYEQEGDDCFRQEEAFEKGLLSQKTMKYLHTSLLRHQSPQPKIPLSGVEGKNFASHHLSLFCCDFLTLYF